MSVQEPLMYAELLANIRQISVVISLETPCGSETAVDLSSQRDCITIRHDGQTSVLPLPGQVAAGTVLQKPALGNKDISWRLPLAGELTRGDLDTNESPWAANILGRDTELFCRSCDETVVKKGSIKIWKDLPSENWAEMMDFWHCHKPTEHENQAMHSHSGDITANKGYGANSKFTAQSDVGFVNLTTFLLEAQDCQNVKVETSLKDSSQVVACSYCSTYIGHVDDSAQGYRLYKWRLKSALNMVSHVTGTSYTPSTSSIVTAQLQSIMLAQCCSKLILIPMDWKAELGASELPTANGNSNLKFLHLWVLNPTIRYTTTAPVRQDYRQTGRERYLPIAAKLAMKVFWKRVPEPVAGALLDTDGVEEMVLPLATIDEIEEDLVESANLLPRTGRTFQDWAVGMMDRWDASIAAAKDKALEKAVWTD